MTPKELKGKTPDKIMQATDDRKIEIYGQPSAELLAQAVCRILVKKILEDARKVNPKILPFKTSITPSDQHSKHERR